MEDEHSNILSDHFRKVRDDTGIHISRQMKMHDAGYKIVKADEGGSDVYLKCIQQELLEYTGEDEFSLVGNIIAKDGDFSSAEIIDSIIITVEDINMVRAFLDEVELIINHD